MQHTCNARSDFGGVRTHRFCLGDCHGGTRLDFGLLGYAPRELRNGEPLCTSCHEPKEEDWEGDEYFYEIHEEHLEDEDYDCSVCHHFSRSP